MKLFLKSSVIGLHEIVIKSKAPICDIFIGEQTGLMKLNNKLATLLPGNSDNTVINLLRLQPGILASGEQSQDYIIWGSYKGQTQIQFDNITMFNISAYNNNIGAINPLIIKNIQVNKGGYNANIGDRVGGFVNIIGKSGNTNKFETDLNINTQTANGIINIPIAKKISLQTSFRHTYNNFFNQQILYNTLHKDDTKDNSSSYSFGDFNVKLSGKSDNGDNYYVSLIGSNDNLLNNYTNTENNNLYHSDIQVNKEQYGGSLFYGKNWKNAGVTNISASISSLKTNFENTSNYILKDINYVYNSNTENTISDEKINIEHYFLPLKKHNINMGVSVINNTSIFNQSSTKTTGKDYKESSTRLNYFIVDKINLTNNLAINPGLRINYSFYNNKVYFQPRVNSTLKINENLRLNVGVGKYNQFISESSIVDNLGNYLYIWNVNTYLSSMHYVSGIFYSLYKFNFSIEGYYKKTDGLTRYITSKEKLNLYYGNSKTLGLDFFIERKFGKHKFWITYTLSQTKEHFTYFNDSKYRLAPQDQRHEIKAAGLLNFHPFYFSTNYVYGSGIANSTTEFNNNNIIPYSRLDIAFMYKFHAKKLIFETGFSIINLLNTKNIRYNNFYNFSKNKSIYSYASPFTPIVFLILAFNLYLITTTFPLLVYSTPLKSLQTTIHL